MPAEKPAPEVAAIVRRAVKLLRNYREQQSTAILRDLAPIVVDLRSHFQLEDGRTDWSGRTYAYRSLMSDVYAEAKIGKDQLDTVQSALRYHVGNLLRQRLPAEELAAVGMAAMAPKDRLAFAREVMSAQREVAAPGSDVARLAAYAQALLEYVDLSAIPDMEEDRRLSIRPALIAVQQRAGEILDAVAEAQGEKPRRRKLAAVKPNKAKPT